MSTSITSNLQQLKERINQACLSANRSPKDVTLLLAIKHQSEAAIIAAVKAGGKLLGHNLAPQIHNTNPIITKIIHAGYPLEVHMIGHLQSNKIKSVLNYATCVQSVDSPQLLEKISASVERHLEKAPGIGPLQTASQLDIFIQVNTSGETTKFGCSPTQAVSLVEMAKSAPHLRLRGLMTIGAHSLNPQVVNESFISLAKIAQEIWEMGGRLEPQLEISMGMSRDLELAIAAGSTLLRVGSAVFGARENNISG